MLDAAPQAQPEASPVADPEPSPVTAPAPVLTPARTTSVCEAGVMVVDQADPITLDPATGSGSWQALGNALGQDWRVAGAGAGEALRWDFGREPLLDVMDRLGKLHGMCVFVWQRTKVIEVERAAHPIAHPVAMEARVDATPEAIATTSAEPVSAPAQAVLPVAEHALEPIEVEPVAVVAPDPWEMRAGETLRETFGRWAEASGGSVVWEPAYDLPIEIAAQFDGALAFETVVENVLRSYWRRGEKLRGRYFAANKVLLVTAEE